MERASCGSAARRSKPFPRVMKREAHPMECVSDLDAASIVRLAEDHLAHLQALAGDKPQRSYR